MVKVILDEQQFTAIKLVINSLVSGAESVLETDFASIEEDFPDLYHSLVEFDEALDSNDFKNALEIWLEEIDH